MTDHAVTSGREFYPDELQSREWWVNWVLAVRYDQMQDGEPEPSAHPTKQPVAPYDNGSAEPCRWNAGIPPEDHPATSYEEVAEWDGYSTNVDVPAPDRVISDELGVGIIIPVGGGDGRQITLLDWDDVRDPETGEIHPTCAWALDEINAYAEISQSGEGIHQFVFGELPGGFRKYLRHIDDEPFVGDDRPMVEMYSSGRLTAMTGQHVGGSGDDVVDGQQLIDELCYRLRNNSNNSTENPTNPFSGPDDWDAEDTVPSHEEVGEIVREEVEFSGEHPDDWDTEGRSIKYSATLRARDRKRNDELPHLSNWKLIRYAALLGKEEGLSKDGVLQDLQNHPAWPDGDDTERCRRHIRSAWRSDDSDRLSAPSTATLKRRGLLPDGYVDLDELHTDDTLLGAQKWEAWAEARRRGALPASSDVPTAALEHIARERDLYDFDALPEDWNGLPAKAHNRALYWVNSTWADDVGASTDDDGNVTGRAYKGREAESCRTWEDVRYIYEDDRDAARHAAEALLRDDHDFATIDETDTLLVYDDETGVFVERLAEVKGKLKDGLEKHWTTHEVNEVMARLRQQPRPSTDDMNGAGLDNPHICVANGVLDLFEEELKPHSPGHYFTDRVPVEYDENADTSEYDKFLDGLVSREEDRKALVEMVGHALTPDAYERGWKKFLMLTGDTNNGKTVFFSRVAALLNGPDGEEANTANVKLAKIAQNRFSNNSMLGKLANIAGEVDGKKIRNTASIKDITGGDPVEIEPKGKDSFFTALNSTFMFAANDPPIIGERDKAAIASRIVPVELPFDFVEDADGPMEKRAEPEDELSDRLDTPEALSGFLSLAVEGIQRLRDKHGDVSLPETYDERLRGYERNADPMREFGERCLKNKDGDYVVKADATTIYKEFAIDQGHEVGQNVSRVLHDVLRGVPTLNYTDSRPESPDYSDTGLDLRGWDERKRVINRVTLTEEGLEYAREAGLVEEENPDEDATDLPLSPSEVSVDHMDASGRLPAIEATVTGKHMDRFNNRAGHLRGDTGGIDYTAVSTGSPELPSGATVRIVNAKLATTELGAVEIEIDPTAEVAVVDTPDDSPGGNDDATAATDGVEKSSVIDVPEDASGPQANARRIVQLLNSRGALAEKQLELQLVEDMDQMTAEEFTAGLRKALKQNDVQDTPEGIDTI